MSEAAAQGYIKFPEFEERAAAAYQTVWIAELSRFTTDLPRAFRTVPQVETTSPTVPASNLHRLGP